MRHSLAIAAGAAVLGVFMSAAHGASDAAEIRVAMNAVPDYAYITEVESKAFSESGSSDETPKTHQVAIVTTDAMVELGKPFGIITTDEEFYDLASTSVGVGYILLGMAWDEDAAGVAPVDTRDLGYMGPSHWNLDILSQLRRNEPVSPEQWQPDPEMLQKFTVQVQRDSQNQPTGFEVVTSHFRMEDQYNPSVRPSHCESHLVMFSSEPEFHDYIVGSDGRTAPVFSVSDVTNSSATTCQGFNS